MTWEPVPKAMWKPGVSVGLRPSLGRAKDTEKSQSEIRPAIS